MIYLFLAILCSASIALVFKHSETNQLNRYAVTSTNYLTAFAVSLAMVLQNRLFPWKAGTFPVAFGEEFSKVVVHGEGIFSVGGSIIWSIQVGVVAGVFFFLSFIYYQKSVREDGVGLAGTFSKLGILVPMVLSIIFWKELPSLIQWLGIGLSLASILLVNYTAERFSLENLRFTLILLFIFGGMAEFSNKIFQRYAVIDYKNLFLFFVFFTAFWISLYFTVRQKKGVTRHDLITGVMVGIPNLFSSFFLIQALNTIKTTVVFPVYSAGTIVLINLAGLIFFGEKLNQRERWAVVMTIVALILINVTR